MSAILLSLAACDRRSAKTRATYVGAEACAQCHAKEYDLWRGSHHDLAMQRATEESVRGDFDGAVFEHLGVRSTFTRRDGKFRVRTDGPDGMLHDYEIQYTFGVTPLQQYLVEFPGGRLQVLPLCWDARPAAQGGQRWYHLYGDEKIPHDDILHWTGPNQNWNYMCAECHSTNLRKNYDPDADCYRTSWSEINVACEACHGPGSRHVEWGRLEPESRPDDDGLAVHLEVSEEEAWFFAQGQPSAQRKLPLQSNTQVETCARCHARRGTRTDAYVHGRPVLDTHRVSLLEDGLYHADGQILDEVYVYGSFLQSKMYHRGVVCSSCHEPHGLQLKAEGNALCTRCHDAKRYDSAQHHFHRGGSQASACVACHMQAKDYMVVDPRRDHSFRVPRPDLSVELGTPNACNACHADKDAVWASAKVEEWHGPERSRGADFARALHAGRRLRAEAPRLLRALAQREDEPAIVRATALRLLAPWVEADTLTVCRAAVQDEDPLVREAAASLLENLPRAARAALLAPLLGDPVRSVRVEAARILADVPLPSLPERYRGRFDEALQEYVAGEQFNSDRAQSHVNLGLLFVRQGKLAEAESAYQRALRMQPSLVTGRVNLADLYRQRERDAEGERLLREGLAVDPRAAALHHSLGLLLVRRGRPDEALAALRKAAELERDNPRYAYVLGVALHTVGKEAEALALLERAHGRSPGDRELLVALTTMHRDAGNRDVALRFARKLSRLVPSDRSARELLQSLKGGENR